MLPTRSDSVGEIWEQNASILQRLYEVERKTPKEVKQIMEKEHGFPVVPLSNYETRLRDELGLRKKLKKQNWHAVYQHYLSSGGKHTGVYLNGTKIPWEKAWKEIRRSGARLRSECRDTTLPVGVIMRTPSPPRHLTPPLIQASNNQPTGFSYKLSQPPILAQHPRSTQGSLTYYSQSRPQLAEDHSHPSTSVYNPSQETSTLDSLRLAFENNSVILRNIPWIVFTDKVFSLKETTLRAHDRYNEAWGVVFNMDCMGGLMKNIFPFPNPMASYPSLGLGPNFDTYHFITEAFYILSNKIPLTSFKDGLLSSCPDVVYILLNRIPQELLAELFESNIPTIRAAWEFLAHCAGEYGYRDSFRFLMQTGIKYQWILPGGPVYLSFAASMGIYDVVQYLLKIGIRADYRLGVYTLPALVEAAATGSLECVRLLMQHCDVNRIILVGRGIQDSNFSFFLSVLAGGSYSVPIRQDHKYLRSSSGVRATNVHLSLEDETQNQVLSMLLNSDANVDSPWEGSPRLDLSTYHPGGKYPEGWALTILERSYFWSTELFDKLVPYSTQAKEGIIRPYIYQYAKQGKGFLYEYLKSADPRFDMTAILESVLVELFVVDIEIDAEVVQGLLEFGVDPNLPSLPIDINYLLCCLVQRRSKYSSGDNFAKVLGLLLQSGAAIGPEILEAGIEEEGIDTLLLLYRRGASVSQYGAIALARAACLDNYEAVSWLLQTGVDINSTIVIDSCVHPQSVIIMATTGRASQSQAQRKPPNKYNKRTASCDMLRYLIDHGAVLKSSPQDVNAFKFLQRVLQDSESFGLRDKVNLFLERLNPCDLSDDSGCLHGACFASVEDSCNERLSIGNLLFSRGVRIRDGSVLPSLIMLGVSPELVQELLEAGLDINAYSGRVGRRDPLGNRVRICTPIQAAAFRGDKALIEQLLQKGANINQDACRSMGRTALQAACERDAQSITEKACKIEIIQYLLEKGANVNAPPADCKGCTALQFAAMNGDMEVALLLVQAGANLNAPPAQHEGFCALDGAAERGRLDMVQFLLNGGAFSYYAGKTGYDGAIQLAEGHGNFTIAHLIRQHAKDRELVVVNSR
ncbi:hypothetical protein F5Y04DRAFT_286844 [Hypomontagnella monticulosa]|nr:hypothetical protein F5Y04DRAFT_286844 [Hypomontagnella monticulosa]